MITSKEARALRIAVGFMTSGDADGVAGSMTELALSAQDKLAAAPPRSVWLPFSEKDLELLWLALGNGASDDAIDGLGLRVDERLKLGAAANRIAKAGRLGGPRFHE